MEISQNSIQDQIPYYLAQESKANLVEALNSFPNVNYYIGLYKEAILQGDGWSKLEIIRFEDGTRKTIKGIILSNSCDIDPQNSRPMPPRLTFAPIIKLMAFVKTLEDNGLDRQQISSRLEAIREQKITTIFYLPKGQELDDEYIAILDDLHSLPFNVFENHPERSKLFTLSQIGFYLFILKLSVHFCRFHENIVR